MPVYFVENLTLRAWALSIWPRLLRDSSRARRRSTLCYVIDGSRPAMLIARISGLIFGVDVERLNFSLVDVRDEAGLQIRLRIENQDLAMAQRDAMAEPAFRELVENGLLQDRMLMFLGKKIAFSSLLERSTMWRALYLTQVCAWKAKEGTNGGSVPVLFLERRPWLNTITRYAAESGVTISPVRAAMDVRAEIRRRLPPEVVDVLRHLRHRASWRGLWPFTRRAESGGGVMAPNERAAFPAESKDAAESSGPRVAVDYYGRLNLDHPERFSELSFWQESSLAGGDVIMIFSSPRAPLDQQTLVELRKYGIGAVAVHPGATTVAAGPLFTGSRREGTRWFYAGGYGLESRWLKEQIAYYHASRSYWRELFKAYNVGVFVTWYKANSTHCAIADALQSLGGVLAIYQRSHEPHPTPVNSVATDIMFGFSQSGAEIERVSNSVIGYYVTTGFLGDHRFPLLRETARTIRDRLRQHGARRILAYTDENTHDDPRWLHGHHWTQENYAFLLEKVLSEPWLGLVIKPKTPRTLRRRLGTVAELLERAEATGRCYIHEGSGPTQGWYPPSVAALASDIAVHGHLCASTAGVDATLAGVPTLLLDREGWGASPLYRLGVGQVVFTDWEGLWKACQEHWSTPGAIPGLGDWSPMLDELDPFRDGRAAERMGTYIQWLVEGFKAGQDREAVMADAAERYCAIWGTDKVTEINRGLQDVRSAHKEAMIESLHSPG